VRRDIRTTSNYQQRDLPVVTEQGEQEEQEERESDEQKEGKKQKRLPVEDRFKTWLFLKEHREQITAEKWTKEKVIQRLKLELDLDVTDNNLSSLLKQSGVSLHVADDKRRGMGHVYLRLKDLSERLEEQGKLLLQLQETVRGQQQLLAQRKERTALETANGTV
jgi:hypothetical protein